MSESKHTPGPWIQHATLVYAKDGNICEVGEPRKSRIVHHDKLEIGSADWNEGMANARLIAAAPELLDACIAGLGAFVGVIQSEFQTTSDPRPEDAWPVVAQLRAAIAKAKGENHD